MRLHQFIRGHRAEILAEWDVFAFGLMPDAAHLTRAVVRDHAEEMLDAIAADLEMEQDEEQRTLKSKGRALQIPGAPSTAAQTHALLRARHGFDINEMVSEYRALRASVLRLWAKQVAPASIDLQDTIRFNEAIDQSLAESVGFFSKELERSRNLLLGMLGHDMRNPLHVVQLTAEQLGRLNAGEAVSKAASRLISSGSQLQALLDDLVDFNRSNLGVGIRVVPKGCSLTKVFADEVDLLRAANPASTIELKSEQGLSGVWDAKRLHQVLGNLVTNAIKYGDSSEPVEVVLSGSENDVTFSVSNAGRPIPADQTKHIFEPLKRGLQLADGQSPEDGMGLGLYIVSEIVKAHGGEISVLSSKERTTFTTVLPRDATAPRVAASP